ncbi:MAG: hypothetical protein ACPIOQ_20055 [Promethearchaeia archaeon]
MEAGLTGMLQKPVSRDVLRARIATATSAPCSPWLPPSTAPALARLTSVVMPLSRQSPSPIPSPVSTAPATPAPSATSPAPDAGLSRVSTEEAGAGGTPAVLVCDPDSGQRLMLKKLLTKLGRNVTTVHNGVCVRAHTWCVCVCVQTKKLRTCTSMLSYPIFAQYLSFTTLLAQGTTCWRQFQLQIVVLSLRL